MHMGLQSHTLDRSISRVSGTPSIRLSPFHMTPAKYYLIIIKIFY